MQFTAEAIAAFLSGEVVGDKNVVVSNVAKIEEAKPDNLAFLSNPKYEEYIYTTNAGIVLVNKSFEPSKAVNATLIKVNDAYEAFASLLDLYLAAKPKKKGVSAAAHVAQGAQVDMTEQEDCACYIGEFAVVENGAKIGRNAKIYPHVYVGDNVTIGDNVILYSGVKIYENCVIGSNVIVHSGAVIGADGFGFAPMEDGTYRKIPQIGNVVIEDDVEIGANVCIDSATMGSTVIRKGVKIDNMVQIAHNVVVGDNTVMASQVGIAGSTRVGRNVMIGGQVGIVGHIEIADKVKISSKSGVSNSIVKEGEVVMGNPSMNGISFHRSFAVYKQLPDLRNKVLRLEKELECMKGAMVDKNQQ